MQTLYSKCTRLLKTFVLVVIILIFYACAPTYAITTSQTPFQLGETTVTVVLYEAADPGLTYFNLHDNENTSVLAGLSIIGEFGGRVLELRHSGRRNITFQLDGTSYEFDPNRMFTDIGCAASLERFGAVSDEAIAAVRAFAEEVLQLLDPSALDVIVTLHNNTNNRYSVLSYDTDGEYASEAQAVHVNAAMDPDDFYFITDQGIYDQLRMLNQNAVLQDNVNVTDDGSLSIWSAQQNLPYVNVEAQNGHKRVQIEMIQHLHDLFTNDN